MALNMRVINKLLAEYSEERKRREAVLDSRREIAFREEPALRALDIESRSLNTGLMLAALEEGDRSAKVDAIHKKADEFRARRAELLALHGHPADWLNDDYVCNDCSDTGYVGTTPCHCLLKRYKKAVIDDLMDSCGEPNASFERFDLSLYSDEPFEGAKRSPRQVADDAKFYLERFARDFSVGERGDLTKGRNFYIYGAPGLGKTYLACCAARHVAENGFSVMFADAADLFYRYECERFGRAADDDRPFLSRAASSELLVLDNLGGEASGQTNAPSLSRLINARLDAGLRTIITSTLSHERLGELYSRTIASRISGRFYDIYLYGSDLRSKITELNVKSRQ